MFIPKAIFFTVLSVHRTQWGYLVPTYHCQTNSEFKSNPNKTHLMFYPNANPMLGLDLGLKSEWVFRAKFILNAIILTDLSMYRTQTMTIIPAYHSQTHSELNPNPDPTLGLGLVLKVGWGVFLFCFVFASVCPLCHICFTILSVQRTHRGNLIPAYHTQTNSELKLIPNPMLALDLGLKLRWVFRVKFILNAIIFTVFSIYRTQTMTLIPAYHPQTNSKLNPILNPKLGLGLKLVWIFSLMFILNAIFVYNLECP